jgi:hypothetical protein
MPNKKTSVHHLIFLPKNNTQINHIGNKTWHKRNPYPHVLRIIQTYISI